MDLNYLNPLPVQVRIDDDMYELAPVSLRVIQWIDRYYSDGSAPGSQVLDKILKNRNKGQEDYNRLAVSVIDLIFYLLIDKDIFPTICIFKNTIAKTKGGSAKAISELYMAVTQAFYNADPINKSAPDKEPPPTDSPQGRDQGGTESLPDWVDIYTRFENEYGYTVAQFYELTYRQVDAILKSLNKQKQQEAVFQASLVNQRLEPIAPPTPRRSTFTPEESKAASVETQKLFEKLKNAHG